VYVIGLIAAPAVFATDAMPVAQQNALVAKYCAVCHTDAARNGGLTLQHFDAATVAPSLAAMMTSKLTGGALLHTSQAAASDPAARGHIAQSMKTGAMGAAGIPIPDLETVNGLIDALAARTEAAFEWYVEPGPVMTASILRELPSTANASLGSLYQLVIRCDTRTGEGEMQLAWSPVPQKGRLRVSVDGVAPVSHKVEGSESMGNGSGVTAGPAATILFKAPTALPVTSLTVSGLFPKEAVQFPFNELSAAVRRSLQGCFRK
jgi:hypothetical protein